MNSATAHNLTRGVALASELGVADTFLTRLCGLLATPAPAFGHGRGLWITPSQGVHTFGMRYAIDALYLDRSFRIIHIHTGLRPWRVGVIRRKAAGVLELPAGTVQRTLTRVGDQVGFTTIGDEVASTRAPNPAPAAARARAQRQSGQTIAIFVLFLAALLGIAALSTDIGVARVEETHLQTVADAAAVAGAAEIPWGDVTTAAQDAAASNGFSSGSGGETLTVNDPPASGPHTGDGEYVEVIATETLNTYFANVFGITALSPSARAVAHLGNGTGCMYALNPAASGAVLINGAFDIQLQCGLYINSTSSSALEINGSGSLSATAIGVAGGAQLSGSVTVSPSITEGIVPVSDPLASLPVPSLVGSCASPTLITGSGSVTLNPGVYCTPLTVDGDATVTFKPGTYILDSGFVINGRPTLVGDGVTFYNAAGAFTLDGSANSSLSAPTTGPYAGILFFQARTNVLPFTVNGDQGLFNGTIYAPAANIVDNGGWSGSEYGILVGATITINGSATFNADFSSLPGGSPIKAASLVG
ncbi:MAG: DUF192 domain-containing protein [Terriglobales bacterium]